MNTFTTTITSDDPTNLTGNYDINIQFPYEVDFPGRWVVCMTSINYQINELNTPLYLYTSIIQPQVIGSGIFQLLNVIPGSGSLGYKSYSQPIPVEIRELNVRAINNMEMQIIKGNGNPPIEAPGDPPTIINLQFIQLTDGLDASTATIEQATNGF